MLTTEDKLDFQERVVAINRCAKVVKGGRRFSFSALVVVGNTNGKVGVGIGKAKDVAEAIRKGTDNAHKHIKDVTLVDQTLPHPVVGTYGAVKILMRPASKGTGVIAGGSARSVLELAGVHNVLTKVFGSTNPVNVVKATLEGLLQQRAKEYFDTIRKGTVAKDEKTLSTVE
ncbi:MAG: 30S ribosomal protein S5 [Fibrobacteria bacterium]|nr:30S ribosomal protein S5 [Fibrobacteria bacterium]